MSFDPFVASAPGKIILSGEHAVVHGAHAVATVVDRRAYALFSNSTSPDSVQFQFEYDGMIYLRTWTLAALQRARQQIDSIHPRCWNVDSIVDEKDETARVVDSIGTMDIPVHIDVFPAASQANSSSVSASDIAAKRAAATIISAPSNVFLMTFLLMFRAAHAVTVKIVSTVPMGSGMGSSAAFCTSLATGFFCLSRVPDAPCAALASPFPGGIGPAPSPLSVPLDRFVVNAWAFQGERLVHGTPSGVDNTCSVYGGVIVYRRRTEHPAEATNDIHTTNVDSFAAATAAAAAAAEAAQALENKEDSNSFPAATLPVKRSPVPVRQGDAPEVYFLPSGCIPPSVELVVTDTRVPKDTRALVAGVGKLRSEMPEVVVPLLLAIDGISSRLISAVKTYCSFASVPPVSDAPIPSSKDADKHFEKVFAALSKKFDRSIARLEAQLSVAEASETKASADSGLESDSDDDNDDDDDEIDDDDSTSSTPPAQLSDIASRAAACVPEVSPAYDDLGQSLVSYKRVSVSVLRRRLAAARLRRDAAVAEAFFRCVGPLMSKNHELLNAIGVGHIALDTVVAVGNELGMHTKLTGAGGGGCAITLLPPLANKRSTLATSANKYAGELASAPDGPSAQSSMSEHHRLAAPEMIPRPHSGASGRSGVPANSSFPSGSSGGFTTLDAPMGSAPPAAIASAPQQTGMKRSALSCIALSIPTMPNVDSTTSLTSMGGSAAFDNGSTPLVSTLTLTSALSLVPNSASGGVPVPGSTPRSGLAGSSSRRRGVAQIAGGPISETGSSPSESPGAVTPPTPARALRPAPPTKTASSGSGRATPPVCRSTTPSTGLTPKHSNSHSSTQGPSHGRVHVASVPQPARAFDYDPVKELERRMEMRNFRCYRTQIGQGGANVMSMEDFISLGIA